MKPFLFLVSTLILPLAALAYTPGDGTGLKAQIVGPISGGAWGASTMNQFNCCETQTFDNVALNTSKTLFSDGVMRTPYVNWRGKLIVPENAYYTFQINLYDAYDGVYLKIGDKVLLDFGKAGASPVVSSPIKLGPDEYEIAIDYSSQQTQGKPAKCILSWTNSLSITEFEQIPKTQFKPDTEVDFPTYVYSSGENGILNAALTGRYYGGTFFRPSQVDDDSFVLNGFTDNPCGFTSEVIGRYLKGVFQIELTYDFSDTTKTSNNGAYIYLCNSNSVRTFVSYRLMRKSASEIQVGIKPSKFLGDSNGNDSAGNFSFTADAASYRLRMIKEPNGSLKCYSRALPDGPWMYDYGYDQNGKCVNARKNGKTNSIVTYPDDVFVGFGVLDHTAARVDDVAYSFPLYAPQSFEAVASKSSPTVDLVWSNAANHVSFKIQYRHADSNEWITVAENLAPSTETYRFSDGIVLYEPYMVKIVSVGADGEEKDSEIKEFVCGTTGLYGAVMGPAEYNAYSHALNNQFAVRETRLFSEPYLYESGSTIFTTTNFVSGVVCWRGTILIPTAGTNSFKIFTNDGSMYQGGRIAIDGTNVVNRRVFGDAMRSMSGSIELTAGLHSVEIDYGVFNESSWAYAKHFEVHWKRPGDEDYTKIPPAYFRPTVAADDLPSYNFDDGYEFRYPGYAGSESGFPFVKKVSDGVYKLIGSKTATSIGSQSTSILGKRVKGPFKATFALNWANAPKVKCAPVVGLCVVRNNTESDNFQFTFSQNQVRIDGSITNGNVNAEAYAAVGIYPTADWVRLMIVRTANKQLKCKWSTRSETGTWSPWTTQFVYDVDNYKGAKRGDFSADELYVGVSSGLLEEQTIYDFEVKEAGGLMLLVR